MLMGVLTTLIWEIPLAKPFALNSSVVSVPVAILVLIVVTLLTAPAEPVGEKPAL